MVNKQVKMCLKTLFIREIQNKTKMRCHSARILLKRKVTNDSADTKKFEPLYIVGRTVD